MKFTYRIAPALFALVALIQAYNGPDISKQQTNNLQKALEIFQESTKITVLDHKKQLEEYVNEVNGAIKPYHQKLMNNLKEYNITLYKEMEKLYLENTTINGENIVNKLHDFIKTYINSPQLQVTVKDFVETVETSIKKTSEEWNEVVKLAGVDPWLDVKNFMMVTFPDIRNYVSKLIDKNLDMKDETITQLITANSQMNATIEGLRKKIEQKNTEECNKLAADGRLVRAIKSQWFSEAEKTLQGSDNSTYKYIIGEVYNNQPDNFLLILHFAEFIRDIESKFQVYDALHHEITNQRYPDLIQLIRLFKSIQTNILDQSPNNSQARLLSETVRKGIEKSTICIKNTQFDEYLFTSTDLLEPQEQYKGSQRYAYTMASNKANNSSEFKWRLQLLKISQVMLFNVAYDEPLYSETYTYPEIIANPRGVFTRNRKRQYTQIDHNDNWKIEEITGSNSVRFENLLFPNEYLHSRPTGKIGKDKRRVYVGPISSTSDQKAFNWDIINCP